MKIERDGFGRFDVYLDRIVGRVRAENAKELTATIEHYYRPEGFRRSHIEGDCRSCPLCRKMKQEERARRRKVAA